MIRFMKGLAWIAGGAVVGTAGVMAGAAMGLTAGGPGVCLAALGGAMWMTERGMRAW